MIVCVFIRVESVWYGLGRRAVIFKAEPIWDGGLSWKQLRKGKDWYYLSLLLAGARGERRGEGESTHIERRERKVHKEPSFKRKMK